MEYVYIVSIIDFNVIGIEDMIEVIVLYISVFRGRLGGL